jgi:hypothetical protein
MAKQVINIGTRPNSKDGDAIRDAFNKVNQNFTELYAITSGTVEGITELAQDYAAQMLVSGVHSGITVNYDDINNRLNLSLADQISTDLTGSVFSNNSTLLVDAVNGTIPYSVISGTPTTLAGYGITDSPTDISDLSDTQNLLGQAAGTSLAHVELRDRVTTTGSLISFTKEPNTSTTDPIDTDLELTRPVGIGAGLINIAVESSWNTETSPAGTEWNWDGWTNLDDVKLRTYSSLRQALRHRIGENIVGAELVMHDTANDKYYKMQFSSWAQGPAHTGAFAYTRQLIDTSTVVGLNFADGSALVKAPKEFVDLPQIFSGDTNEYILGLADRGKHVYAFTESVIRIPTDAQVNFPIGSTIFVVTGVFAANKVVKVSCTAPTTIEREGSAGVLEWALKPYSTTMLIKVAENKWNLSGGMNLSAVNQSIIPTADVTYDLGSQSKRFRDLYLSGNTIDLGGIELTNVNGSLTTSAPIISTSGISAPSGRIDTISVVAGGSGYLTAPSVTVAAPASGTTATATATVSSGSVVSVSVTNSGSGYTSTPTVTIAAPTPTPNKVAISLSSASGNNWGSGGDVIDISTNPSTYAYQVWIILKDRPLTQIQAPAAGNNFLGVWDDVSGGSFTPQSYGSIFTALGKWPGQSGNVYLGNVEFIDQVGYPKYLVGYAASDLDGRVSSVTQFDDGDLYFDWSDLDITSDEEVLVRIGRSNPVFAGDNAPDPDVYPELPLSLYEERWFQPTTGNDSFDNEQPVVPVEYPQNIIDQGKNTLQSLTTPATVDPQYHFDAPIYISAKSELNNTVTLVLGAVDFVPPWTIQGGTVPVYPVQPNTTAATFVAGSAGVQATAQANLELVNVTRTPSYNDIQDLPTIPVDVSDLTDTENLLGSAASLTVTIPGEAYKGFGARYGRVYANSSTDELTISKIVIFKDTASAATSTIHPTSSQDDFAVSGLADSDIVALFVLYGDTNSEKSLDTLKAFARTAIDTVILNGGVAGQFNTIAAMRTAFYNNINTLTAAAGGLVENFEFFEYDTQFTVSFNTTGQGTGTGFNVNSLSYNLQNDTISLSGWSNGTGYTPGDQIVIPGTSITYDGSALLSPDNDVTVTITAVSPTGQLTEWTVAGTLPRPPDGWPANNISDGGNDQYDNANYINTNLAQEISYNGGVIVEDATTEFGTGSKYVALYDSSIFGFIATGSSAANISTSGNSGADGNSTTDTGALFETDRTYDPALSNLTLTNDPLRATPVSFTKADYATANNVDVIEDDSTLQIGITRGVQRGIYNPFTEEEWDSDVSPQGTLWNTDSTDDLSDIESRTYTNFYAAYGGNLGNVVPGSTAILYVPTIEKYYLVEWTSWTQNNAGGGFAYTRTEIDVTQVEQGLRFADGSVLTTAEGLGRVKSTAPGSRRIEEVVGYKEIAVTERTEVVLTTTASRSVTNESGIWVDTASTTIDDVIIDYTVNQVNEDFPIQFSLDNVTWYNYSGGRSSVGDESVFFIVTPVTYNQGDTIYFRYTSGGFPVTWWNKSELPGGSANFRGAVIDYHAYTGESTIIGTIHIVDDDGEEHISHQEVQSGSSDGENDDLWFVTTEGRIQYRRIDGESKTLKVHWTAKVFYGSELYD